MIHRTKDPKLQDHEIPGATGLTDDIIISPDAERSERLPPRQARTRKWPVLDAHGAPDLAPRSWSLEVSGLVDRELAFDSEQFLRLPRVKVFADMHCVTRWSRLGNLWEGVSTREILSRAGPGSQARFVVVHGYDSGWTTNLPLEAFIAEDVLLADTHDGTPLSKDHGGPVRLVVPRLYAWKSAKWIRRIDLVEEEQAGYWERGGYHMLGDPWSEQRFRSPEGTSQR